MSLKMWRSRPLIVERYRVKNMDISTTTQNKIEDLSQRIFGTRDYEAILAILPPYDGMVREFEKEVKRLTQRGDSI